MLNSSMKKLALGLSVAALMWSAPASAQVINLAVATGAPFSDATNEFSALFSAVYSVFHGLNIGIGIATTGDETNASNLIAANGAPSFDVIFFNTPEIPEYLARHYPKLVVGRPFPVAVDSLVLWSPSVNISAGLPAPLTTKIVIPAPGYNKFSRDLSVPNDNFGTAAAEILAQRPWRIPTSSIPNKLVGDGGAVGTTWAAIHGGANPYAYGLINRAMVCRSAITGNDPTVTAPQNYTGFYHVYEPFGEHPYNPELVTVTAIKVAKQRTADQETAVNNYVALLTAAKDSYGTTYYYGQNLIRSYCYELPRQFGRELAHQ